MRSPVYTIDKRFKTFYAHCMATRRRNYAQYSPIDPSIHFILFLGLALVLVVLVASLLIDTSKKTRAYLFCPKQDAIPQQIAQDCRYGIELVEENGCQFWKCKLLTP